MAPKRSTPVVPVPASESDEEETTSSGEEEEEDGDSSSEEDQTHMLQKQSSQPQLTQTSKPDSTKHGTSESESESGTDSESEDLPPPLNVKPISSKPMEETSTKSTNKISKSTDVLGKSTTKRGSEADKDGKDSKRPKKKDSETIGALENTEDTKKQLFQRLWSEDDEIALLKGIIAFVEKKATDPAKDMNGFYDFIKKSLHFGVVMSQLKEKISRLKRKFENHASKGKHGEDKTFSKAHDQLLFDISKEIWGTDGVLGRSKGLAPPKIQETEKVKKMKMESQSGTKEMEKYEKNVTLGTMEDYVIKRGLEILDGAKKSEMEEKWRKLQVAELELFLKRNDLIKEHAKLLLASYGKSGQH